MAAREDENSGARRGTDAYCHDNVTNVQQKQSAVNLILIFFSVCPVLCSCPFMTSVNIGE